MAKSFSINAVFIGETKGGTLKFQEADEKWQPRKTGQPGTVMGTLYVKPDTFGPHTAHQRISVQVAPVKRPAKAAAK